MKVINIKDIAALKPDQIVESIKGIILSINEQRSEPAGDFGNLLLQSLVLKAIAPDEGEFPVVLKERDALPLTVKGRQVYISCANGARGLSGVKVKDKTDKATKIVTREISVTKTANIEFSEGGAPVGKAAEKLATDAGGTKPPAETKPPAAPSDPAVGHEIGKRRHLLARCIMAAYVTGKQLHTATNGELQLSEESIRCMGITLYIDCHGRGLHMDLPHNFELKTLPKDQPPKTE